MFVTQSNSYRTELYFQRVRFMENDEKRFSNPKPWLTLQVKQRIYAYEHLHRVTRLLLADNIEVDDDLKSALEAARLSMECGKVLCFLCLTGLLCPPLHCFCYSIQICCEFFVFIC